MNAPSLTFHNFREERVPVPGRIPPSRGGSHPGFPQSSLVRAGGCAFLRRWRDNGRHGGFPADLRERVLIGTVGLDDEDLRKRLEGIVIERRFILRRALDCG